MNTKTDAGRGAVAGQVERPVGRLEPERAVARVLMPNYWLQTLETRIGYTRRGFDRR